MKTTSSPFPLISFAALAILSRYSPSGIHILFIYKPLFNFFFIIAPARPFVFGKSLKKFIKS